MFFNGLPHCVFVEHLWIMKCPLIKGLFYQGIDSGRTFVSAEIWKVFQWNVLQESIWIWREQAEAFQNEVVHLIRSQYSYVSVNIKGQQDCYFNM